MKNKSLNKNNAGQSTIEVGNSQKHEVNLQKNSTLYFQIGLILCLLGTFALFEMQFKSKVLKPERAELAPEAIEYTVDRIRVFKEKIKEESKIEEPKKKQLIEDPIVKENHYDKAKEDLFNNTEDDPKSEGPILAPGDVEDPIKPEETIPVANVQFVPIFPGCEKYELNSERRKCLNEQIGKLVKKKFDTDIAHEYGLSGIQRIYVEFKVDKLGAITDIRTRAPHPKLEEEANRLAHKIPNMEPGKMGTTPVNVIYNLPITFKVQN